MIPGVRASEMIGAKPRGVLREVSLCVGNLLCSEPSVDHWVVACSGGADSLALTVATADWCHRLNKDFTAVIVDHQLRSESAAEAASVAADLIANKIPAVVVKAQVRAGQGIEAQAREARYQALVDFCNTLNHPTAVLVGHTQDDQAETVLLKLARGAGMKALAGMPQQWRNPQGIKFHRPFLAEIRRRQTEEFCNCLGLEYVQDPTNFLDGPWKTQAGQALPRVALRHQVLPQLKTALGQDPIPALNRVASQAREDEDFIFNFALKRWESGELQDQWGVRVDALEKEAKAVRMRIWKLIFAQHSHIQLTSRQLQELDRLITDWQGQKAVSLPGNWQARRIRWEEKTKQGEKWYKTVHKRILVEQKN